MTRSKQLMYSYIVAKYKTMNHKRKRKIIKKRTKQTKNVVMRKSRLFPIRFADSLKNEKNIYIEISVICFFCFIYLKIYHLKKKFKVYGYIPSFPVVLIVQLYHKMALAKNLYEPKKTLCQPKCNER